MHLGFSDNETYFLVILPQVLVYILPVFWVSWYLCLKLRLRQAILPFRT